MKYKIDSVFLLNYFFKEQNHKRIINKQSSLKPPKSIHSNKRDNLYDNYQNHKQGKDSSDKKE